MSETAWFGTDGMRGAFGHPPLERATIVALGEELGLRLRRSSREPTVILAGDTRDSLPTLASWLVQGLTSADVSCRFGGVLPTPAVARLVVDLGAAAGIAISASHNPWPDNGVKLVSADGFKWPAADEAELERRLRARLRRDDASDAAPATPPAVDPSLRERYLSALLATLGAGSLTGLRVVLDAANGAAATLGAEVFGGLGASVELLNAAPDGTNINRDCGSLHPEALCARTRTSGAAIGFAFDGDADRALLVDEHGAVRDGDAMLYLWATDLARRGDLPGSRIVATSMSNLGLERALRAHGIGVERCDVGDRAVVETLRREGLALGGEQSGHLVDLRDSTTGDGLLTAARVAAIVARSGRPASELLRGFERFPQLLRNVRVARKPPLAALPAVLAVQRGVEERLGGDGRLVLRYSGTEPLARIMIEGPDAVTIDGMANELEAALRAEIGA